MKSAIFYRCLTLSLAAHGLAVALGVGVFRKVPATVDAEVSTQPLFAEIVSERELMNPAPSVIHPAPKEGLIQEESAVPAAVPIIPEPVKAPQKKIPRVEPKPPKVQSKVSAIGSEATTDSGPNRTVVEGAVASERNASLVQASPGYYRNPPPEYPESARRGRREGVVRLLVLVDSTGNPTSVTVSVTSGFEALDRSAVSAVKEWHFRPGSINGVSVASQVEVPIRFSLKDASGGKH